MGIAALAGVSLLRGVLMLPRLLAHSLLVRARARVLPVARALAGAGRKGRAAVPRLAGGGCVVALCLTPH